MLLEGVPLEEVPLEEVPLDSASRNDSDVAAGAIHRVIERIDQWVQLSRQ